MTESGNSQSPSAGIAAVVTLVLVSLMAWLIPGPKDGVFGRLSYGQLCLACALTLAWLSGLLLVLTPEHKRRAVGFRSIAVLMSCLATLFICEIACGLMPIGQRPNPWYLGTGAEIASKTLPFERPPDLHWEGLTYGDLMLPGETDPEARKVIFRTDHEGFRNKTDLTKADLVFIGDSYTEAGNVREEHTFVALASEATGLPTRNLGRAGYSTPQQLIVLQKYAFACEPRVIVWQISEINDLLEIIAPPVIPDGSHLNSFSRRWSERSPTWKLFTSLRTVDWPLRGSFTSTDGRQLEVRFSDLPGPYQIPVDHPGWPQMKSSLESGIRLCVEQDIPLIVVHIPMKFRCLEPCLTLSDRTSEFVKQLPESSNDATLAAYLQKLLEPLDVPFVDLTQSLRRTAESGSLTYLQYDTHLSPAGHTAAATAITAAVREQLPLTMQPADD